MLPLKSHTPEDYARFINARNRANKIRARERDKNLMRLSELLGDEQWNRATDEQLAAELGVTRLTILDYKDTLIERGRCRCCGQLKASQAHLQKDTP